MITECKEIFEDSIVINEDKGIHKKAKSEYQDQ